MLGLNQDHDDDNFGSDDDDDDDDVDDDDDNFGSDDDDDEKMSKMYRWNVKRCGRRKKIFQISLSSLMY